MSHLTGQDKYEFFNSVLPMQYAVKIVTKCLTIKFY